MPETPDKPAGTPLNESECPPDSSSPRGGRERRSGLAEHGGGEAEGFEQAEQLLEEQATHGSSGVDPLDDAPEVEEEEDPSVHGEADEIESTEKPRSND
jgi:hypothetical protein